MSNYMYGLINIVLYTLFEKEQMSIFLLFLCCQWNSTTGCSKVLLLIKREEKIVKWAADCLSKEKKKKEMDKLRL